MEGAMAEEKHFMAQQAKGNKSQASNSFLSFPFSSIQAVSLVIGATQTQGGVSIIHLELC